MPVGWKNADKMNTDANQHGMVYNFFLSALLQVRMDKICFETYLVMAHLNFCGYFGAGFMLNIRLKSMSLGSFNIVMKVRS